MKMPETWRRSWTGIKKAHLFVDGLPICGKVINIDKTEIVIEGFPEYKKCEFCKAIQEEKKTGKPFISQELKANLKKTSPGWLPSYKPGLN